MTTITSFLIGQNDRLPAITATLTDDTGAVLNLTGCTVKFIMATSAGVTPKVSAAATVTDAANGVVNYAWAAADTDVAGDYLGEFEITFASGKKETCPNDPGAKLKIRVGAELG